MYKRNQSLVASNSPRAIFLDVPNVVQFRCQWTMDINDYYFPVRLAVVQQPHHAQNFNSLDLAGVGDALADLARIDRIVIALMLGV
jgi:hypothetical protein